MFSMVAKKLQKSKFNSELANSHTHQPPRKVEPPPQSIQPVIKKKQTQSSIPPSNNPKAQSTQKISNKKDYDIETLIFNLKRFDKKKKEEYIKMRLNDNGIIELEYIDEGQKVRLEINVNSIDKVQETHNYFSFQTKKFKAYKQSNRTIQYDKQTLEIYPREAKEMISTFKDFIDKSKVPQTPTHGNDSHEDVGNDDPEYPPKFLLPTTSRLSETERLRKQIRDMKEEEKVSVLMDIFKIKKEYEPNNVNGRLKCPVHSCDKIYREVNQLKTHLKNKHPELSRHGIELIDYDGSFDYSNKAMDTALFLGKEYPGQMKKIIKKMKTKKEPQ